MGRKFWDVLSEPCQDAQQMLYNLGESADCILEEHNESLPSKKSWIMFFHQTKTLPFLYSGSAQLVDAEEHNQQAKSTLHNVILSYLAQKCPW